MPTETGFDTGWLDARYPHDCKARNRVVEQACLAHFKELSVWRIADIGSGTGSNGLYFMERIPVDQEWFFIELNPLLLEHSIQRIRNYALNRSWEVQKKGLQLSVFTGKQEIRIEGIQASFLELERPLDLANIDLVTAGAVIDLLSADMLKQLITKLADALVSLLATINYSGMAFLPSRPEDKYFIHHYEQHMRRPRTFGKAVGPDGVPIAKSILEKLKIPTINGESPWEIGKDDQVMQNYLLQFMEEALSEVQAVEKEKLQDWLKQKRQANDLEIRVFHEDLFASP